MEGLLKVDAKVEREFGQHGSSVTSSAVAGRPLAVAAAAAAAAVAAAAAAARHRARWVVMRLHPLDAQAARYFGQNHGVQV